MNWKQKLLTVIALIAFVLIGVGHYLAVETYNDYSSGLTVTEIPLPLLAGLIWDTYSYHIECYWDMSSMTFSSMLR